MPSPKKVTEKATKHATEPTLEQALLAHVLAQAEPLKLPSISHLELPPDLPDDSAAPGRRRGNNFAALILQDGTVGLTYVALDNALAGLREQVEQQSEQQKSSQVWPLSGQDLRELAHQYLGEPGWQRALGLAAINAISQFVMAGKVKLPAMPQTLPMLGLQPGDHVGMVGQYGRLLDPIRAAGARLTVIELDPTLVREEKALTVTLDHSRLQSCQKIIVTGTTLLNGTLDNVLSHCQGAEQVNLLGPSASCLPEPLFDRGVTLVGGFQVSDSEQFLASWRTGQAWREAGVRYQMTSS